MYADPMNLKGTLPTLILQVLAEEPRHGYSIAQVIKKRSKGVLDFREGALYPALHAQEARGFIKSYELPCSGRVRRYYRITDKGSKELAGSRATWKSLSEAVDHILEGNEAREGT